MSKIRILSEHTINQIAAGEVIESPSSVVKELIENSLDARASKIQIEIHKGGFASIRITDDGCGMSRDDVILSLERHATSKLFKAEDLFQLNSLGFRGEALASIAAISKLTIWTRNAEQECGTQIKCHGGKILSVEDVARNVGTTIEITYLFYNVPARKKFQKSVAGSTSEMIKLISKQMLASPLVTMSFSIDGKALFPMETLQNPSFISALKDRMDVILSLPGMKEIQFKEKNTLLTGFLGDPSITRTNRAGEYLFLNGRVVQCKEVSFAIEDAYGTRIPERKYPTFVIHLTLDPSLIDVNVHPQKHQVRLREEALIKGIIRKAVGKALDGPSHTGSVQMPKMEYVASFPEKEMFTLKEEPVQPLFSPEWVEPLGLYQQYLLVKAGDIHEADNGLLFIDLKALQQALYFETIDRMLNTEKSANSQALFFPEKIILSTIDAKIVGMHLELLQRLGIDIRPFGENEFIIEALPPYLSEEHIQKIVQECISQLKEDVDVSDEKKKLFAKKISQIAGDKKSFDYAGAKQLLKEWMKKKNTLQNPLGKSITLHLSDDKIKRLFSSSFEGLSKSSLQSKT